MTLSKAVGQVSTSGQLQVPSHLLRLVGAKPGQQVDFVVGPRGVIQVTLKKQMGPKPRTIMKKVR